ncbi:MORN repeat-containing protein [Massilia antarctica]|uniref:MORN repeat-containing protein n=1 Tax=Massilia antarctica TaxID=2765360 RepID=UPI0006BB81BD|nr:hypothetical protein [Massilia sp. H27-R4]MCY0915797.1 hypothetical protein [Massilia sp. H27-R4]
MPISPRASTRVLMLPLLLSLLLPLAARSEEACKLALPDAAPGDDMRWQGPCKDGYAHGMGVIEKRTSDVNTWRYEGMVEAGRPHGKGYLMYYPGHEYGGEFRDGLRDGTGTSVNQVGDRYKGQWKAGKREGKGAIVYTLGGSYDGEWKNDRPNGNGVALYSSGRRVGAVAVSQPADGDQDKVSAAAKAPPEPSREHDLKAEGPRLGTHIAHKVVTGGQVPFKASYEQLSEQERAIVRGWYPLLDPADEPPYPLLGNGNVLGAIQKINAHDPAFGLLSMVVMIDSEGKAQSVNVYVTPDAKLSEMAGFVAMNEKYKPARCSGKPCAMAFPYTMVFNRSWF